MVRFRWDIYLLPPAPPSPALWIFRGIITERKAAGYRLRIIYLFPPATPLMYLRLAAKTNRAR